MHRRKSKKKDPRAPSAPPGLEVRRIRGKGRGVFATRGFLKGEVIERCPVIPLTEKEWKRIGKTRLGDYVYDWTPDGEGCALILGLGSLYNHSYRPNARNHNEVRLGFMEFLADRTIRAGEEITVNYNDEDDLHDELWFTVES